MVRKGMAKGMVLVQDPKLSPGRTCEPCLLGKQSRQPILKQTQDRKSSILERVFSDVCGKMQTHSRTGYNYFVTFIDDTSRHVEVAFLKEKSEVLTHLKTFVERAEVSTGVKVKILRSDGGGEYGSKEFKLYLDSKGIQHEKTNAYTPQENGVAERMNRTLVESS